MSDAQRQPEWVAMPSPTGMPTAGYGANPCKGRYFTPAGRAPKVAFVATHPNLDFSEHYLGPLLAERGFGFLGWNTKFQGDEAHFLLDHAIADIGAGVRWLRAQPGIEAVVVLGNSGGGSLMAAYQSQSVEVTIEPAPGLRLCRGLDDLPRTDLYVSLAAHPGRAHLFSSTMDPSVTDETDPTSVDPTLDMYDEANGPPYRVEFQERYRAAQIARNRRVSEWALAELERLAAGPGGTSDRLFVLYRLWADLRFLDGDIDPNARPIPSCWNGDPRRMNHQTFGIGQVSTLRTWLNMWSLDHSQFVAEQHLPRIEVPALVINADADSGIFPVDARFIHEHLGAQDKTLLELRGDHYFRTPADRGAVADAIAAWVDERV